MRTALIFNKLKLKCHRKIILVWYYDNYLNEYDDLNDENVKTKQPRLHPD